MAKPRKLPRKSLLFKGASRNQTKTTTTTHDKQHPRVLTRALSERRTRSHHTFSQSHQHWWWASLLSRGKHRYPLQFILHSPHILHSWTPSSSQSLSQCLSIVLLAVSIWSPGRWWYTRPVTTTKTNKLAFILILYNFIGSPIKVHYQQLLQQTGPPICCRAFCNALGSNAFPKLQKTGQLCRPCPPSTPYFLFLLSVSRPSTQNWRHP